MKSTLKVHNPRVIIIIIDMYNQEHMSSRRRQGASNYVERHLHLRAFSAFRIRTVLDYGEYPLW